MSPAIITFPIEKISIAFEFSNVCAHCCLPILLVSKFGEATDLTEESKFNFS